MIDSTLIMGILVTMDSLTDLMICINFHMIVKAIRSDTATWHALADD